MHTALVLAPLTLSAVLVLSGIAKAKDLDSTANVMRLLRLPDWLQFRGAPRSLVLLELVTAVLLLTPWLVTYRLGAGLALALFVGFWVVVVRAMGFNPRPTCGCFGRIGDHRINGRTVGRNTVLVALAAVAVVLAVQGPATGRILAGLSLDDLLWLVLAMALAAVAVLILGSGGTDPVRTWHQTHDVAPTTDASGEDELDYIREPIPDAIVIDEDNVIMHLRQLPRTGAHLLVLVNCWCGPTHACIERLPSWQGRLPQLDVHLVFATERPFGVPELRDLTQVWWDPAGRAYDALHAGSSPSAVLLGADGLTAGGPVNGIDAIEDFVAEIVEQLEAAAEPAPHD